jgi:ABC-type glutathione transport system ATPase component
VILEVRQLRKTYRSRARGRRGEHVAVDDLSFDLEAGRTLAIVGESGAGKSTVARLVLRLVEADGGSIRFDGEDITQLRGEALRRLRPKMQLVFQDPYSCLNPRVTVGRSVAEPFLVHAGFNRADSERRATELLRRVGVGAELAGRYPSQLSGGQLQRVSIARALALDPKFIVCDEAVSALDVSIRAQVLNLMLDIQEELGVAYIFIAHDLRVVESFADDVLVMQGGRMVETGPVTSVFEAPASAYTRELLDAVPQIVVDR